MSELGEQRRHPQHPFPQHPGSHPRHSRLVHGRDLLAVVEQGKLKGVLGRAKALVVRDDLRAAPRWAHSCGAHNASDAQGACCVELVRVVQPCLAST